MTKTTTPPIESGYRPCACPDRFEIAIGKPGAFCDECDDSGCSGEGECDAPGAYGCDDAAGSRIAELCQAEGGYPIAKLDDGPAVVVDRLLAVLRELAPAAAVPVISIAALEALKDPAHPAWNAGAAEELLHSLMAAVNAHAPEGFLLQLEGESIGFYSLASAGI